MYVMYEDWQKKSVPLWSLVLLVLLVGLILCFYPLDTDHYDQIYLSLMVLVTLAILHVLFRKYLRVGMMGAGDYVMLPLFMGFLPLTSTPPFLILTGFCMIVYKVIYPGQRTLPLISCMGGAYFLTKIGF